MLILRNYFNSQVNDWVKLCPVDLNLAIVAGPQLQLWWTFVFIAVRSWCIMPSHAAFR